VAPLYEAVPPRLYGGTERIVAHLTDALVELGREVTLFAGAEARTRATLVPVRDRAIRLDPCALKPDLAAHLSMLHELTGPIGWSGSDVGSAPAVGPAAAWPAELAGGLAPPALVAAADGGLTPPGQHRIARRWDAGQGRGLQGEDRPWRIPACPARCRPTGGRRSVSWTR
jgi:hypothetical protein